jgi:hypothetical protein
MTNYKYNKSRHFKLLEYSKKLEKQEKALCIEDSAAYSEFSEYDIAVSRWAFWSLRKEFILLLQKFDNRVIGSEEFVDEMERLWQICYKYPTDLEKLVMFRPNWIFNDPELDPDIEIDYITTEKQLREAVKIVLSSISKVSIKVIPDQKIETLYNLLSVNLIEIVFVIFFLILINKSIT